jgi:hypothetical protein
MSSEKLARELYGTRKGDLAFIVGMGPSIVYAKNKLKEPRPNVFRIAINKAIEEIPAEYWFWIDGDAYEKSKDHPNAKAAIRIGVDKFRDMYDPETFVWERCLDDLERDLKDGKLVHRATSLIGAISVAMRMGSCRIVMVGCDNHVMPHEIKQREAEDAAKDWNSVYTFTFARINEALANTRKWLPKEVMLRDASKIGTQWGDLPLKKTTIGEEIALNSDFHKWLEERNVR